MTITRLDAVSIFNDKLTFLIPHEWTEVESDENDTYQYQSPDATSGFFRVSLITGHGAAEKLRKNFQKEHGNVEVNPTTENFIADQKRRQRKVERGFTSTTGLWAVPSLPM